MNIIIINNKYEKEQILVKQFDSPPAHVRSSGVRLSVCPLIYETAPLVRPLVWLLGKKSAAWLSSPSCEKSPPTPVYKLHINLLFTYKNRHCRICI